MNSRLNKLFGVMALSCLIIFDTPDAYSLPVSEQVGQCSNGGEIVDTIYSKIVDGDAVINISEDSDLGIRADIDISKEKVKENEGNIVTPSPRGRNITYNVELGQEIADFAKKLVGKPYVYGSTGPNSFDCSGFIVYVYRQFGISLPRTSQAQAYVGNRIGKSDLLPGDLVFSNTYGTLSHVGIYIGNGKFVHAANSSTGVTISDMNDGYYGSRYAWSTRPY